MQKIATSLFVCASIVFGITGILLVVTTDQENGDSDLDKILIKILFTMVFIILPSFALSVAGKYLNDKS